VHNVSQWPNLRHLGRSLGGAEGLLEAVSLKKACLSIYLQESLNNLESRLRCPWIHWNGADTPFLITEK